MSTSISAAWLQKGHFDFSGQDKHDTTSLQVKASLCTALGLQKGGLKVESYPVGPQFRHIYWWREGSTDYAEAQFMAAISKEHPVLSLGISVEKGGEDAAVGKGSEAMDRHTWDWQRLIKGLADILSVDVPALAKNSKGPVHVRVWSRLHSQSDRSGWHTRAFSFVSEQWFERHAGRVRVEPEVIIEHVRELDGLRDTWAIVQFARDFGPGEADGMSPSKVAGILIGFNTLRRRLRPQVGGTV